MVRVLALFIALLSAHAAAENLVSVEFKQVHAQHAFETLAELAGVRLRAPELDGIVTARFEGVDFEVALRLLTSSRGLEFRKLGPGQYEVMKVPDTSPPWVPSREQAENSLMRAVYSYEIATIETLLRSQPNLALAKWGRTGPLQVAAERGYLQVLSLLLKYGAADLPEEHGESAVFLAAKHNNPRCLSLLVRSGERLRPEESEVLFSAKTLVVFKLLLEAGARPDVADRDGRTLLFPDEYGPLDKKLEERLASYRLLLEHGVPVDCRDNNESTPFLSAASKSGRIPDMEFYLSYGADPEARNAQGQGAVHFAASLKDDANLKFLLGIGIATDTVDNDGMTAFHYAAKRGRVSNLRLLLKANPSLVGIKTKGGLTALALAERHKQQAAIEFLRGINVVR